MKEFIEKVQKMRRLQRAYFSGERDHLTLRACKQAEQEVDICIAGYTQQEVVKNPEVEHPKLF